MSRKLDGPRRQASTRRLEGPFHRKADGTLVPGETKGEPVFWRNAVGALVGPFRRKADRTLVPVPEPRRKAEMQRLLRRKKAQERGELASDLDLELEELEGRTVELRARMKAEEAARVRRARVEAELKIAEAELG